ncbi:MAG TPA: AraC family transcriptional regulator [Clostridia bacterium]
MVLTVLLADDEPSALRSLRYAVEKYCKGFEVVYCAKNGQEALDKAIHLQPDILITDIKMPLLDGIGLVEKVIRFCPSTSSVIVSGYQEFEYAKGAMRLGVVDYLLKPLDVAQLCTLLEKLRVSKLTDYYNKQVNILNKYVGDADDAHLEEKEMKRYFPFKGYTASLIRINGLPSRFTARNIPAWYDPAKNKENIIDPERYKGVWVVNGRDDAECFIFRAEESNAPCLKELSLSAVSALSNAFYTITMAKDIFQLNECKTIARRLWRIIDNNLILGLSHIIDLPGNEDNILKGPAVLDSIIQNRIAYLVSGGLFDELKNEIISLFNQWELRKCPQIRVEQYIRQIIGIIARVVPSKTAVNVELDILLDEALSLSTTFGELLENIWQIITEITLNHAEKGRIDTLAFFKTIEEYVKQNLRQPLSLESVCSHIGISQTYLSRLFRKYTDMSFNKYITLHRIKEAKKLIDTYSNILVQDVAYAVGYDNPSYFSKVFREVVGVTPTEYALKKGSTSVGSED